MLDTVLTALMPHVLEILGLVLTLLIGWAAKRFRDWTGIQIEEKHQRALHQAAMTAATAAIARGMEGAKAVEFVDGYIHASVPDAVAALKPSAGVVSEIARSKLAEVK